MQLGKYKLLKKIASGGMAEIWLARQEGVQGFEKLVVIKRILEQIANDETFVSMFLDEARLAARLSHPGIVQIYDLGQDDGTYYIAMEHIHGEDLRQVLRRVKAKRGERVPPHLVARLVAQASEALYYAHTLTDIDGSPLGIVHRDISPQNLIVSYQGQMKVVDFGIAKAATQNQETRTGVVKGKFTYMSPEQCLAKKLDARSDQFALGAVTWELLTGRRLFERDNDLLTMRAICEDPIPSPREFGVDLPESLEAVVMKALSRDVSERFADCHVMQMELERFLQKEEALVSHVDVANFMREHFEDRLAAWREMAESARQTGDIDSDLLEGRSDLFALTSEPSVPSLSVEEHRREATSKPPSSKPAKEELPGKEDGASKSSEPAGTSEAGSDSPEPELHDAETRLAPAPDRGKETGGGSAKHDASNAVDEETRATATPALSKGRRRGARAAAPPVEREPVEAPEAEELFFEGGEDRADEGSGRGKKNWLLPALGAFGLLGVVALLVVTGVIERETDVVSERAAEPGAQEPDAEAAEGEEDAAIIGEEGPVTASAEEDSSDTAGLDREDEAADDVRAGEDPDEIPVAEPVAEPEESERPSAGVSDQGARAEKTVAVRRPSSRTPPSSRSDRVETEAPARPISDGQPSSPPERAPGYLSLNARPWCEARVEGGAELGVTPLARIELPAGHHRVVCANPELGRQTLEVKVEPGEELRRSITFLGELRFRIRPWAVVTLDGEELGATPMSARTLPAGTYTVVLENEDLGVRKTERVEVKAGETYTLSADLTR